MKEKLTPEQQLDLGRAVVITKWQAYRALEENRPFYIGDRAIFVSVRKRLKSIYRGRPDCEEKLALFRLL